MGYLNVDETQMLLALRGQMGKAYITFPDPKAPDQMVTMRFHQENLPEFRASLRWDRPHVAVRLLFEGEVLAISSGHDYVPPQERERLAAAARAHAESTLRGVLDKLRKWGADPVGFGHLVRGRFPTWEDWVTYT